MFEVIEKCLNKKMVCVILAIIILFPFALNFLLQLNNPLFSVVGNSVTWLNFWPTYLSSIASFIMAYIAFISLRQVQCQMEEAHRKEEEQKRANLKIDVVKGDDYNYYIRFRNVGHEDAYNIVVKIDIDEQLNSNLDTKACDVIQSIQKAPFFVPTKESTLFYIGSTSTIDRICESQNYTLRVEGHYNIQYILNECINIKEFVCKRYGSPRISFDTIYKIWFENFVINGHLTNDFKSLVNSIEKISDCLGDVPLQKNENSYSKNKITSKKSKQKR